MSVFGEEVLRTPAHTLWVCVWFPDDATTTPPRLDVTTTPARIVTLELPHQGSQYGFNVYVYLGVTDPGISHVEWHRLPIPPDGNLCLLFQGRTEYNPGGCAVAVTGASTFDDQLNDILDDLPPLP
ncbi:MAG TPA: hypothetical protein VHN37_01290 [Actinomycetota bacterium]|nr:hypothetical protein [Actinomycetota bacterium]